MPKAQQPTIQRVVFEGIREIIPELHRSNFDVNTNFAGKELCLEVSSARSLGFSDVDMDSLALYINSKVPGVNLEREDIKNAVTIRGLVQHIKYQLPGKA